jgi:hypothetical protein
VTECETGNESGDEESNNSLDLFFEGIVEAVASQLLI